MTKKILIGYITGLKNGGINKYLLNVVNALKDEECQIDMLTSCYTEELERELNLLDIRLFNIHRLTNPIKRYKETKEIVKRENYDIVYFNISEAFNCICNIAVKRNSDSIVITHSHSSNSDTQNYFKRKVLFVIHKICQPLLNKNSDYFYSCSLVAGEWLFGKKVIKNNRLRIIRNTVDTNKFKFNQSIRDKIRTKYGIKESEKVIGFVGNLVYQKNPLFLLDVFDEIHKINPHTKLLIIGEGFLRKEVEEKISSLILNDSVILTGHVENVNEFMSAMDCFVLPSIFEGMPIVGIEAQSNLLECFFSDTITEEVSVSNLAHFISINESPRIWAEQILSVLPNCRLKNISFKNVIIDSTQQIQEFKDIFIKNKFMED